ncbi:MAG TPA: hypothetical protein VFF30_03495 [Nitrososphaerales archaeon]|nr:hypothetical protein [Nitrososphaerales archaeon]
MDSTVTRVSPPQGPVQVKWVTARGIIAFVVPIIGISIALASGSLVLLDWVHVLSGGTWTGIDIFMGFVLSYVLRYSSPMARAEVARRLTPITMFFIPSISSTAITAGYFLASRLGVFSLTSPLIDAAGVIIVVLLIQGLGIFLPNSIRVLLEFGKPSPDLNRVSRLMMLNFKLSGVQAILQIALIFVMASLAMA